MFYICGDSNYNHKLNIKHYIMLQFEVNGKLGKGHLVFPTNLNELNGVELNNLCSKIHVADNHSLVCLCYRETIGNVLFTASSKKKNSITTAVVPLIIKSGKTDNEFIKNIKAGEIAIIPASDLALGYHVYIKDNPYTIDYLLKRSEGDTALYQRSLSFKNAVYFTEFKIVPNCNIKGYYEKDDNDTFK